MSNPISKGNERKKAKEESVYLREMKQKYSHQLGDIGNLRKAIENAPDTANIIIVGNTLTQSGGGFTYPILGCDWSSKGDLVLYVDNSHETV